MASDFIKAQKVVATALGLLLREINLAQIVWRDPGGDFAGALNDTISVRLPAYAPARRRALRSGAARTKDTIHERKVDLTLDIDIYKWVGLSDEQLTLDIANFGQQVLNPIMRGVAEQLEQEIADAFSGASYENTIAYVSSTDDPYSDIAVRAREYLNNAHVPMEGRFIAVGSGIETEFLNSDKFIDASKSGSTQTLRESVIGRVAEFDIVRSPVLPSNEAYAGHRTACAFASRIPVVPDGAPWGANMSFQGFAMRAVRAFDIENVEDQLAMDSWCGVDMVKDHGHYTDDPDNGGKFVPVTDPANPATGHTDAWDNDAQRLVRAVKITAT
jgi:hypothetical protein